MSDETVEVKVRLPKPKPGYSDWEKRTHHNIIEGEYETTEVEFVSRRVAPPERMVTLTLKESDAKHWASLSRNLIPGEDGDYPAFRLADAARRALAQEACEYAPNWTQGTDGLAHRLEPVCALPKGHEGSHRP